MGQYDFNSLYGQADSSIFVYDTNEVDAVVESSTWGRTKDGAKGQWDVRFRVTTGPNAGRAQIRFPMTITTDGPSAAQSLGIMFRHLEAMGIPADWVKSNPPEEQIAQAMVGKPVLLKIVLDEYEGVQRNKVRDVRPPRPGAPTTWPTYQPQQPAAMPGYGQQPGYGQSPFQQPQYAQPQYAQPQQGYAPQPAPQAPAAQPWNPMQQPQQPAPGYGAAPAPYQPQQQAPQQPQQGQPQPQQPAAPAPAPAPGNAPWNGQGAPAQPEQAGPQGAP